MSVIGFFVVYPPIGGCKNSMSSFSRALRQLKKDKTKMNLEKLRRECPFGVLSCRSDGGDVKIYVRTSSGSLIARINTKLTTDGSLEVMSIRPLISDQEGSQSLMALAEREKIPHNITSTIINQIMNALPL